jgi:hypothetical protein
MSARLLEEGDRLLVGLGGEGQEGLLEVAVLGAELVQLDFLSEGKAADFGGGQAGDPQLVGSGVLDPRSVQAGAGECGQEPVGVWGADRHPGLPVGELSQGALADQAAVVDNHHLVDELLDLGEDVAGDQHGPTLVNQ